MNDWRTHTTNGTGKILNDTAFDDTIGVYIVRFDEPNRGPLYVVGLYNHTTKIVHLVRKYWDRELAIDYYRQLTPISMESIKPMK